MEQSNEEGIILVIETGKAELGDKTKSQTKDAAKAETLRKAVERAAGVYVSSKTEVKNFILESDEVNVVSKAFVQSVCELEYSYNKAAETGTYKGEFVINVKAMEEYAKAAANAEKQQESKSSGEIQFYFAFYDANGRRLREGDIVHESDQYQIMGQPFNKCFVYIINRDASGAVYPVFPREEIITTNPLAPGQEYYFPDGDNMLAFDDVVGMENFYIVASLSPLCDIDILFQQIKDLGGNASKELASAVESRIKMRGGGRIVQKYTGKIVSKIGSKNAKIAAEILKSTGSIVRQINLLHEH